jgi:adenylate cyclase
MFSHGCKMNDDREFVRGLGHCLNACGAPVDRLRIIIRTLHPEIVGAACSWSKATDATTRVETPRRVRDSDRYIGSPLQQLIDTEETVRQRLDRLPEDAHRAYTELLEEGFTDYLAMPVITAQGFTSAIIIVTAKSGGLGAQEIDNFHQVRDYLLGISGSDQDNPLVCGKNIA